MAGRSPHMNVIGNVWRIVKQRLRLRKLLGAWNIDDPRLAVQEGWDALTSNDWRYDIVGMLLRV